MSEEMLSVELNKVEICDEEGNKHYYVEEMIIPYDGKFFAILVSAPNEECGGGCSCHNHGETDAIIARIEQVDGEDGEYLPPTDEEFEAVLNIYETVDLEDDSEEE